MAKATHKPVPFFQCEVVVDAATEKLLRMMGADGRISADHIMVRNNIATMTLTRREINMLGTMGLKVKVGKNLLQQAQRVKAEVLERLPAIEADSLQTGFVTQYLDTNGIFNRFQSLHTEFPTLTQWVNLPHSTLGYDGSQASLTGPGTMKLFRINTTPASIAKPGLLLISNIHAREWITPLVAIEFAEQLLRTYTPGSINPAVQAVNQMVEGLDILIIPTANPDGVNFSHHDFAMWRKNRRSNPRPGVPCASDVFDPNGVDNNRNYSIYWGEAGSSGDVCSDSFRGQTAFSEAENRNILHVIEQFPNILIAVDCHSFGEDIFRAQPTGGAFIGSQPVEPHDHNIFLTLEAAMNAAISSISPGKTYSTGTTNNHAGTGDDYLFLAHRIFGFTIECGQQFQPPIATALGVVQEVAAAMRALGRQALSLSTQFTYPVNIAHVIDRSGSMVAFGYAEPAKFNVRRMVDLMSLNDSLGIVSFNQSATTHIPLTAINNPGVYTTGRNAVDAIAFGGFTSIGAGLQSAGNLLSGAAGPKAIILLSDGYQNRMPWVADVLPALPVGTKVHTIALGPQSDQPLLQTIAAATGGQYYFSPDELELHEIYNYIRADAAGEELAFNETLSLSNTEAAEPAVMRRIVIDGGNSYVIFSVSWDNPDTKLNVTLQPPQGPVMNLSRVRQTNGKAYKVLRLRRPQAGLWSLTVKGPIGSSRVSCTAAAFLRSNLRLRVSPALKNFITGKPIQLLAQVHDRAQIIKQFTGTTVVSHPAGSLQTVVKDWKKKLPTVPAALLNAPDALPKGVLQALIIAARILKETNQDPLRYLRKPDSLHLLTNDDLVKLGLTPFTLREAEMNTTEVETEDNSEADISQGIAIAIVSSTWVAGTYNVKIRVEGRSASGQTFVRVALRSIYVS